jgi:hypothetical protein
MLDANQEPELIGGGPFPKLAALQLRQGACDRQALTTDLSNASAGNLSPSDKYVSNPP